MRFFYLPCVLFLIVQTMQPVLGQQLKKKDIQVEIALSALTKRLLSPRTVQKEMIEMELPGPDGTPVIYKLSESNTVSPALKLSHPQVRSYEGTCSQIPGLFIAFTITSKGLSGILTTEKGYLFLENDPDGSYHLRTPDAVEGTQACEALMESGGKTGRLSGALASVSCLAAGTSLKTYRIAIATTEEFTSHHTDQATAFARVQAVLSLTNAIWKAEASISFQLVTTKDFCFTENDPYGTPPSSGSAFASQSVFDALTTAPAPTTLPYSAYDLAHTIHFAGSATSSASGQATLGGTCNNVLKARGWTQFTEVSPGIVTDALLTMVLAHEIGHQLNVSHSFNSTSGGCSGNRDANNAYETGSGNTLMSYQSVCAPQNTGLTRDTYLHVHSRLQALNFVISENGKTCGTNTPTSNIPPVADAGKDYVIPKGTPFMLTGSGSDGNGDLMKYRWEQYDPATADDANGLGNGTPGAGGTTPVLSTTGPIFRSRESTSSVRIFPSMNLILNSVNPNNPEDTEAEDLSQTARNLTFRLSVLDSHFSEGGPGNTGGSSCDEMLVTVSNSGPFRISNLNGPTHLSTGCSSTITWDVNGTTSAPVNCSRVDIDFSYDGGVNWISLAANTPNDGSELITMPGEPTTQGRFRIKAVGNIFFDINDYPVVLESICTPVISNLFNSADVILPPGNSGLKLNPMPYGAELTSVQGYVTATDPVLKLTLKITSSNACGTPFSNSGHYKVIPFTVDSDDLYTFTRIVAAEPTLKGVIVNLYQNGFTAATPCTNWLESNTTYAGGPNVTAINTFSQTLAKWNTYYLVVSGFNETSLGNFAVNITAAGSGKARKLIPEINTGTIYTYVIEDASGNIKAIDPQADLSNAAIYPLNTRYTVHGLSFPGNLDLSGYVGKPLSDLQSRFGSGCDSWCGALSINHVDVAIDTSLPVRLTKFEAIKEGTLARLNWSTAADSGSKGYEIEHSADGKRWLKIGYQDTVDKSGKIYHYIFTDVKPANGENQYRLKMIDTDGTFSYSNIVSLNFALLSGRMPFPNPVSDMLYIPDEDWADVVKIDLTDLKGVKIYESPSIPEQAIDLRQMVSGMYIVSIVRSKGGTEKFKIIVNR